MYHRAQMKQEVKQMISATRPRPMWIALLYLVITSIGSSILQSIFNLISGVSVLSEVFASIPDKLLMGQDPAQIIEEIFLLYADRLEALIGTLLMTSLIVSIILTLWQGLMSLGFDGYCLSLVRGEKPGVSRIFCGFPLIGKVILTSLLVWIFTSLWMLLYGVCLAVVVLIGALLMDVVPVVSVLLFIAGYVGFMILAVRLTLRYAMTNYILLDTGKYGLDAISESKRMMKGKKGKLFMLQLSFIGWYLIMYAIVVVGCVIIGVIIAVGAAGLAGSASLGAVAGMVGGVTFVMVLMLAAVWLFDIWLLPYVTGSVAKFYLFFKPQEPQGSESWPELGSTTTYSEDSNTEY